MNMLYEQQLMYKLMLQYHILYIHLNQRNNHLYNLLLQFFIQLFQIHLLQYFMNHKQFQLLFNKQINNLHRLKQVIQEYLLELQLLKLWLLKQHIRVLMKHMYFQQHMLEHQLMQHYQLQHLLVQHKTYILILQKYQLQEHNHVYNYINLLQVLYQLFEMLLYQHQHIIKYQLQLKQQHLQEVMQSMKLFHHMKDNLSKN